MRRTALFSLALLMACTQAFGGTGPSWPPSEPARVRFTGSFSGPKELGIARTGILEFLRALLFGKEDQRLVRPYGVAVRPDGKLICVTDPGLRAVHVFDLGSGASSLIRGPRGQELATPIAAALDAAGRLYVADSGRAVVVAFDLSGRQRYVIQGLKRPTGLAVWKDRLYVADTLAHKVLVYRTDARGATLVFRFGSRGTAPGQFNFPVDLCVDGHGRLLVNDTLNFRVQVFDLQGNPTGSIGSAGDSTGHFQRSKGIGADSDGNLYVVDALASTVQIFDLGARFLMNFGGPGAGDGEFWLPSGLAFDASDRLYVADTYNRRVQTFQYVREGAQ